MTLIRMAPRGFSLIELLVVISIIGILTSLLLPAVQRVRDSAVRSHCQNQLKQIALGLTTYESTHGRLPPARADLPATRLYWSVHLLPMLEQTAVWLGAEQALQIDLLPFNAPPHQGQITPIPTYQCPADGRLGQVQNNPDGWPATYWSYLGVGGGRNFDGALGPIPGLPLTDLLDGTSTTAIVGERPPPANFMAGWWYSMFHPGGMYGGVYAPDGITFAEAPNLPGDFCSGPYRFGPGQLKNLCDRHHFWSLHLGGANFAFADGSVRFLPYSARTVLVALSTRNGGETDVEVN
jgi:prepilin-type N-terminal cleavage/methylation domain-containing protein/prepilin-type processing-associated H-X9-DG protein